MDLKKPQSPPESRLDQRVVLGVSLAIAGLLTVVYAQVRRFDFVFLDDPVYVVENQHVREGLSSSGVRWAFSTGAAGNWHPLTWTSHMLDVDMFGMYAGGHHVTSVIIHVLTSILVFSALYRMTNAPAPSAFVAALFAVHPIHVESVAWISERKDVLSGLFCVLTLHAYVSFVRRPGPARNLLVILMFALGLMSKPMLVTLPFALLLLDYWPLRRISPAHVKELSPWKPLLREKALLFVLSGSSAIVTVKVQRSYGAVVELGQLPFGVRLGNALVSYVAYIGDLIWPAGLAAFYPFHPQRLPMVGMAIVLLTVVTFLALKFARSRPYLIVGWLWYVGTLIPAIGVVQVGDQARADRYMYLPSIGLLIIAAWGVSELATRWKVPKPIVLTVAASVVALCIPLSMRQASYWRSNLTLFSRAVSVTTGNYRAEALLGVALADSGRYDAAIEHYRASIKILPSNAEAHSNLGAALVDLGRTDDAVHEFSEAVRYRPDNAVFHYNLGVVLNQKGRAREALDEILAAARLDPENGQYASAAALLRGQSK